MKFTTETARATAKIQGETYTVPQPFAEGQTLTTNEAAALNQVLVENVRNNMASQIKKAKDEGKDLPTQADVDKYVEEYEFGARRGGAPADPVEREALEIAKGLVRDALKNKGYKLGDVAASDVTKLANDVLEKHGEQIRKQAAAIVKQREKVGIESLDVSL